MTTLIVLALILAPWGFVYYRNFYDRIGPLDKKKLAKECFLALIASIVLCIPAILILSIAGNSSNK